MAKDAVARGDATLRDANNTYYILAGFQSQVQNSSEAASLALQTVPSIEEQIQKAEQMVIEANESLNGAHKNALAARTNAQDAQEKYAEQASKVDKTRMNCVINIKN